MEDDGDGEARDGGAGLVGEREVHDEQPSQCNARQYRKEVLKVLWVGRILSLEPEYLK